MEAPPPAPEPAPTTPATPPTPPLAVPPKRRGLIPSIVSLAMGIPVLALELWVYALALKVDPAKMNEGDEGCALLLLLLPSVVIGPALALVAIGFAIFGLARGRRTLPVFAIVVNLAIGFVVALILSTPAVHQH